jgi:hypothetical protein
MCISNGEDCSKIKACSSHQHHHGLIVNSSEIRHYSTLTVVRHAKKTETRNLQ